MCPCLAVSGQPAPSAVLFYLLPSAQICKWCLGGGGCGGSGREGGEGPRGEGRRSAVTGCRAALPAPSAGGVGAQPSARGRGPGAWGRGRAGFRASRAAPGARWPPELRRGSQCPEAARPRPLCVGRQPRRGSPGSRGGSAPRPWSLRTRTPRRRRRRRLWRRRARRPRPSGVVVQVREKKGPCAPPSPTCPSRWPSSASSSTLSCRDWVRRDGRDPLRPGPRAGARRQGGVREGPSAAPTGCKCRAGAPLAPWQVAKRVEGAPGGAGLPDTPFPLRPGSQSDPASRAGNFDGNVGVCRQAAQAGSLDPG